MLNVQQLAQSAVEFAQQINGEDNIFNPRIDEVERAGETWSITISWLQTAPKGRTSLKSLPVPSTRIYKQFAVNGANGEVTAMKIRQVQCCGSPTWQACPARRQSIAVVARWLRGHQVGQTPADRESKCRVRSISDAWTDGCGD